MDIYCDACGNKIIGTVFNVGDSIEVFLIGSCCFKENI